MLDMTAAPMTVRICYLYPRLLSVAGDRGNLFALMQRCAWRGIRYSVTEADVGVVPDFAEADLILLHGGQDREMTAAAQDLAAKSGPLREAIESDAVVLAVCAGYQLLGRYYVTACGRTIEGAGILDVVTVADPRRLVGAACVHPTAEGLRHLGPLVGFQNHAGRSRLGPGCPPLGYTRAGLGNDGHRWEGAVFRHCVATYLHGPLLPRNPHLADWLLAAALRRRGEQTPLPALDDRLEWAAHRRAIRLARP